LDAAGGFAAFSTSSPSLKFATRTWRARSGGKNPSISPPSACRSRAFARTGCSSSSAERIRSIFGRGF